MTVASAEAQSHAVCFIGVRSTNDEIKSHVPLVTATPRSISFTVSCKMVHIRLIVLLVPLGRAAASSCPFGHSSAHEGVPTLEKRAAPGPGPNILAQFTVNDTDVYLTSDAGGPISDQNSLTAGERGPTLLEDFIFRQKITHFDHERVRQLSKLNQLIGPGAGKGSACARCR
jgi:hypothetical protein